MKQRADVAFSTVILVMAAVMVWQARDWPTRSQLFPLTIGLPTIVLATVQVVVAIRRVRLALPDGGNNVTSGLAAEAAIDPRVARLRLVETSVWIVVFTLGVVVLGFTFAAPILVAAFLKIAAREPWRITLALAGGVYLVFYIGFGRILHVPFPAGLLADALKLDAFDNYLMRPLLQLFH